MDNKQNGLNEAYKFYVCSVGQPGEGYDEENLERCVKYSAHFLHKNTAQKGPFDSVTPPAVAILKYKDNLVAYGKVVKARVDDDNSELGDWTYRVDVKEWIWKDPNNHEAGVSKYGVGWSTVEGSQYATIKQVDTEWGLGKINEINGDSDLAKELNKLNKLIKKSKEMNENVELLESNRNLILTGAPGTGKTHLAKRIASKMILGRECGWEEMKPEERKIFDEHCKFVQFHPSYDYTDFVEGLRPTKDANGNIGFELRGGVFKEFCGRALKNFHAKGDDNDKADKFVFIIDEINRGDISKIFGELFFSIDPGYRGKDGRVQTQYQNLIKEGDTFDKGFYVPDNVYIIGTMNDIDRSVESMDFAMRRRFAWKEIKAESTQEEILKVLGDAEKMKGKNMSPDGIQAAKNRMDNLNAKISDEKEIGLNSAYHIGASYFMKLANYSGDNKVRFDKLWENHLEGVLREYLRGSENVDGKIGKLRAAFNNDKPVEGNGSGNAGTVDGEQ